MFGLSFIFAVVQTLRLAFFPTLYKNKSNGWRRDQSEEIEKAKLVENGFSCDLSETQSGGASDGLRGVCAKFISDSNITIYLRGSFSLILVGIVFDPNYVISLAFIHDVQAFLDDDVFAKFTALFYLGSGLIVALMALTADYIYLHHPSFRDKIVEKVSRFSWR